MTCYSWLHTHTHARTHTHTSNGPFSGTIRVSQYQKGKTSLDFTEARDSEWQWHQLGRMQVCTSLQTDNRRSRQITTPAPHHSVFYRPDAVPDAQPTASKHWRQQLTAHAPNHIGCECKSVNVTIVCDAIFRASNVECMGLCVVDGAQWVHRAVSHPLPWWRRCCCWWWWWWGWWSAAERVRGRGDCAWPTGGTERPTAVHSTAGRPQGQSTAGPDLAGGRPAAQQLNKSWAWLQRWSTVHDN